MLTPPADAEGTDTPHSKRGRCRHHRSTRSHSLHAWWPRPEPRTDHAESAHRATHAPVRSQHRSRATGSRPCSLVLRYRMGAGTATRSRRCPTRVLGPRPVRTPVRDVPVVLVGHSLGGRTALRIAGDPLVVAVAALVPRLPDRRTGRPARRSHDHDRPRHPRQHDEPTRLTRVRAVGPGVSPTCVRRFEVERERHAMLWRYRLWQPLTTIFVFGVLGYASDATARGQRACGHIARRRRSTQAPRYSRTVQTSDFSKSG